MNLPQTTSRIRPGFTLIELLFVIAIIAVLSTMALGVMRKAQDDAKAAATLSRISQIEAMLQIELEDYEVRRLPVALNLLAAYVQSNPLYTQGSDAINVGFQVRNLKRRIMQDIINVEMPRPSIAVDSSGDPIRDGNGNLTFQYGQIGEFPSIVRAGTGTIPFADWIDQNLPGLGKHLHKASTSRILAWNSFEAEINGQGRISDFNLPGEYLYQLLATMDFDGSPAIEQLGNAAIGDSDDDGFLEVVDAWGEPMQLRIWQVDAVEVDSSGMPVTPSPNPTTDIWQDVATINFDSKDGDGIPTGYSVIDPVVPREVNQIRFEIVSRRLVY